MVTIVSLWIPIVLSAVLVFVVSSIIHMVLGYHRSDFKKLPAEDQVMEALRKFTIAPGDYCVPRPESHKAMQEPAFKEKQSKGPIMIMTVIQNGPPSMGPQLFQWFLYSVLVGVIAAYVTSRAVAPGASYLLVFRFAGTTAFACYSIALLQNSIWYKRAWSSTLKSVFDGLIYGAVTASAFRLVVVTVGRRGAKLTSVDSLCRSIRFALLTASLFLTPHACGAQSVVDSTALASDSLAAAAAPRAGVTVTLADGSVSLGEAVEPAARDHIALLHSDRGNEYIPAYRVRRITLADGKDVTNDVLVRGARFGPTNTQAGWTRGSKKVHSERSSFPLLEFGLFTRIAGHPNPSDYSGSAPREKAGFYANWQVGGMANVGHRSAVGGTLCFGADDDGIRTAIRGRYRRWLSRTVSLDLSPGIIVQSDDNQMNGNLPGFSGGASLAVHDAIEIELLMEAIPVKDKSTETAAYLGSKLGSGKGLWIPLGITLILGVALAAAVSTIGF